MKIGMLSYPGMAGCGIVAVELGHELAERGHDVHFFSCNNPFRLNTDHPKIVTHLVQSSDFDLFTYPDQIFPLITKVAEITRLHGLDVLHAHYAVPFGMVALMAKQVSSRSPRLVMTLHGTDITILSKDSRYRDIIRHTLDNSDAITAVTKKLIETTTKRLGVKKPIHIVPNFPASRSIKGSWKKLRSSIKIRPDDFVLLHMSNLRPLKRIGDILKALAKCKTKPKLLILAGGDIQECETIAKTLGLSDSIRIQRNVTRVEEYIGISDAGVYASESEQCSLAILETMSSGKPVIATNSGGTPEVIKNTGLLFNVGDVDALAEHIDSLVMNPKRCQDLGIAAKRRTESVFSKNVIVNRYLNIYSN